MTTSIGYRLKAKRGPSTSSRRSKVVSHCVGMAQAMASTAKALTSRSGAWTMNDITVTTIIDHEIIDSQTANDRDPKQKFWASAADAWAAAWAAQRIHGEYRAINHNVFDEESNKLPSNKDTMIALLIDSSPLLEEDYINGAKARDWFQGQLFGLISGELNDFMKRAAEIAIKDDISVRQDAGMISCLPQSYIKSARKENIRDMMSSSNAQHVGTITEKIVRNLEVLDIKKGVSFTGWLVTATEGNNFFRFCSSWECQPGELIHIQAKVKRHDVDRDTNKPVTWLNYVKRLS